jgi:hypothetical protein
MLAVALGVAIVFSLLSYFWARWFYDRTISGRIKRIVLEQFAKADSLRCEIELRPNDLWTRQDGTEITLPWRDIEEVVETGDAIELRFRNGLVVARNRVFSSPSHRAEFLGIAEGHVR